MYINQTTRCSFTYYLTCKLSLNQFLYRQTAFIKQRWMFGADYFEAKHKGFLVVWGLLACGCFNIWAKDLFWTVEHLLVFLPLQYPCMTHHSPLVSHQASQMPKVPWSLQLPRSNGSCFHPRKLDTNHVALWLWWTGKYATTQMTSSRIRRLFVWETNTGRFWIEKF